MSANIITLSTTIPADEARLEMLDQFLAVVDNGEILAEHAWPPLGIRYASKHTGQRSGKRRGRPPKNPEPSPMS